MLTLKQVVVDLKKTQKELASEIGCTAAMMNNYVNKKTKVPEKLLSEFCAVLGISIKAFKDGDIKKTRVRKKSTTNVVKAKTNTTKVVKKTAKKTTKKAAKKTVVKATKKAKKTTKKSNQTA